MEPDDARAEFDRSELLGDSGLVGAELSREWTRRVDTWLRGVFRDAVSADQGVALVAVGGYGRGELSPMSDLDLLLLHSASCDVAVVAEAIFYPIWDAGQKLGHSVRTVAEALELARNDLDTATALLDTRVLGGDPGLANDLATGAERLWKSNAKRNLPRLRDRLLELHAAKGEVAFLLEPDLKESKGGLRDLHALRWLDRAREVTMPADRRTLGQAGQHLFAARVELHRRTGRPGDVLVLQEQDGVAAALGTDADALMADLANAGREIAWISEDTWRRALAPSGRGRWGRRSRSIGHGLVERDGTIQLDADADLDDPVLPLRAAFESASRDVPMDRAALDVLGQRSPTMTEPWATETRELLIGLLGQEDRGVTAVEALEHQELFSRVLPEWAPCRSKPQRNAYHRYTVDRHLLEAASGAARLADRTDRPDLLVMGGLLHDIGKGYPGDHTEVGMELVPKIAVRMGFDATDTRTLRELVRLHLLLPDVATRRDLSDDGTLRMVANEVGDVRTLGLLHALTEADSLATGPAAWGSWKAQLVDELVRRTAEVLAGAEAATVAADRASFPTAAHLELMAAGEPSYIGSGDTLNVVMGDRPGGFNRIAGVLSLHGLDVLDATAYSDESPLGLSVWRVRRRLEGEIHWNAVTRDVQRAVGGRLALEARLADRERTYGAAPVRAAGGVRRQVTFDVMTSDRATFVQVLAPDRMGLLYRVTRALAELDLDIRSAKVQTLGDEVVDSFYVLDGDGQKVTDPEHLAEIERALLAAIDR